MVSVRLVCRTLKHSLGSGRKQRVNASIATHTQELDMDARHTNMPRPAQANLTKPRYVLTGAGPVLKRPGRNMTMREMRDWAIANAIAEVDRRASES